MDIFKKENGYLRRIYENDSNGLLLQSGLFRASALRKVNYINGYKSDDWPLTIHFLQAGYKIGMLNCPLTYYRIHENNTHADAEYCLYELEIPVIRDFIPDEYKDKAFFHVYQNTALKMIAQGAFRKAFKLLCVARNYGYKLEYVIILKAHIYFMYGKMHILKWIIKMKRVLLS